MSGTERGGEARGVIRNPDGKCDLCDHDLSDHCEGPCIGIPGRDVPRCRRCSAASIAAQEGHR